MLKINTTVHTLHSNVPPSAVDAELPYELRALEAALSVAARLLEHETSSLEARSLPALNSLTQKVRDFCRPGI